MKTCSSLSADRLQLISQILGIGRGQYFDEPLLPLPRSRAAAGPAVKTAHKNAATKP